jgi:hypothetical protein
MSKNRKKFIEKTARNVLTGIKNRGFVGWNTFLKYPLLFKL